MTRLAIAAAALAAAGCRPCGGPERPCRVDGGRYYALAPEGRLEREIRWFERHVPGG